MVADVRVYVGKPKGDAVDGVDFAVDRDTVPFKLGLIRFNWRVGVNSEGTLWRTGDCQARLRPRYVVFSIEAD